MKKRFGPRPHFCSKEPKGRVLTIFFCLSGALAVTMLTGCSATVPYVMSAAQLISAGGTLNEVASATQPAKRITYTNSYEDRPYQLISEKNYDEALPILRERADKQDVKAQNQLALLYYEGKGVPEDDCKAAEWMRKAAEGGNATSQYTLAWFYYKGIGVPQDYTKALELLRMADQAGNIYAPDHIAYMYKIGQGVPKDYRQAIDWYSKAAEMGNPSGWTHLAYLYATCKDAQYVDGKRAVAYGIKATEKDPNHFSSWAALAAAYARNNQFEKAMETATKSDMLFQVNTKLSPAERREISRRSQMRLAAFKDNKPYIEENEADQEN